MHCCAASRASAIKSSSCAAAKNFNGGPPSSQSMVSSAPHMPSSSRANSYWTSMLIPSLSHAWQCARVLDAAVCPSHDHVPETISHVYGFRRRFLAAEPELRGAPRRQVVAVAPAATEPVGDGAELLRPRRLFAVAHAARVERRRPRVLCEEPFVDVRKPLEQVGEPVTVDDGHDDTDSKRLPHVALAPRGAPTDRRLSAASCASVFSWSASCFATARMNAPASSMQRAASGARCPCAA